MCIESLYAMLRVPQPLRSSHCMTEGCRRSQVTCLCLVIFPANMAMSVQVGRRTYLTRNNPSSFTGSVSDKAVHEQDEHCKQVIAHCT